MGESRTYNKVHIAAQGQRAEAVFHADMDQPTNGLNVKSRVMEIGSVDDLETILRKLTHENFEIDYLDFHGHGHSGTFYVNDMSTFTVDELKQFRNRGFDGIFRANAIISFMSCKMAAFDRGHGEDGELFLTEMASAFLRRRGGTVVGRNKDWKYKLPPGLGLFPAVGPFTATFKNEGAEIAAEISAGASEPSLRGHFRLDKSRIAQEFAVVKATVNWAIAFLELEDSQPGRSYAPSAPTGAPINDMVARYLNTERNQKVLSDYTKRQKNLGILRRSLASLEQAQASLRNFGALYLRLHKAASTIDDQIDVFMTLGIPILTVLPSIMMSARSMPVKP